MSQLVNGLDVDKLSELDGFIDGLLSKDGALITVLHKAQELFGYLPEAVLVHIARRLDIPSSKVYGVVSFYSFFNTSPKGKFKISVCMGTACFVRGASNVLAEFCKELSVEVGQTTTDNLFSLDAIRCVGACGLAPVVSVNGRVFGRVTPGDVKGIVEEFMAIGGDSGE